VFAFPLPFINSWIFSWCWGKNTERQIRPCVGPRGAIFLILNAFAAYTFLSSQPGSIYSQSFVSRNVKIVTQDEHETGGRLVASTPHFLTYIKYIVSLQSSYLLQDRPLLPSGKTPHDKSTATVSTKPKSCHESQSCSMPRLTDWPTDRPTDRQPQSNSDWLTDWMTDRQSQNNTAWLSVSRKVTPTECQSQSNSD